MHPRCVLTARYRAPAGCFHGLSNNTTDRALLLIAWARQELEPYIIWHFLFCTPRTKSDCTFTYRIHFQHKYGICVHDVHMKLRSVQPTKTKSSEMLSTTDTQVYQVHCHPLLLAASHAVKLQGSAKHTTNSEDTTPTLQCISS